MSGSSDLPSPLETQPHRSWKHHWQSFSAVLFPPCCALCGDPVGDLFQYPVAGVDAFFDHIDTRYSPPRRIRVFCRRCDSAISASRPMMQTACEICGWPTAQRAIVPAQRATETVLPCPRCPRLAKPFQFQRITPLYRYRDAVTHAVVAAKYPANATITRELALRLAVACDSRWKDLVRQTTGSATTGAQNATEDQAAVMPVVTHVPSPRSRQAHRGGSGTRLLARYLAGYLGLPHADLLHTTRPMVKQAWLGDEERSANVRGAFAINAPHAWRSSRFGKLLSGLGQWSRKSTVLDRDVILVDDVMTTGATANEIAGLLLDHGAQSVSLAVVALAMREH